MKKKAHKLINNFWDIMFQPEMLVLPGQLAFFFILSVVPILTLISIGAASFNINLESINSFIAQEFGENISNLLIPSTINPEANLGFIITFIFGFIIASNGASSIIVTSNTIYGIKDQGFIRRRVKSFIMTLFIVILFTFILIVPLFGQKIIEFIKLYSINNFLTKAFNILSSPISWIIIFILIKIY